MFDLDVLLISSIKIVVCRLRRFRALMCGANYLMRMFVCNIAGRKSSGNGGVAFVIDEDEPTLVTVYAELKGKGICW